MKLIPAILTIAAGAALPLQALLNARLGTQIGGAIPASLASFAVGTVALLLLLLVLRPTLPTAGAVSTIPWWLWTGGLLGAMFVAISTLTVPVLGTTLLLALVLFGQLGASLVLDHFAVLADTTRPINGQRLLGVGFLLLGVGLVARA